jgi:DNA-binding CsgD family transcriptional regulator
MKPDAERFERLLEQGERRAAALDAALEAIRHPAFVVSASGTIHEVNASARELLSGAEADVRRALRGAIARRPSRYAFELTPLRFGGSECYLAILRPSASKDRHATSVAVAAARWRLTPRRKHVLEMVVRGRSNGAIAAELGISERAVEAHVSAIFDRAGVENRAALVAAVMQAVT